MKYHVIFSQRAKIEVAENVAWLSTKSPQAAENFVTAISNLAVTLQTLPKRHPIRLTERLGPIHVAPLSGFPYHLVFHKPDDDSKTVLILRILHGTRDLDDIL